MHFCLADSKKAYQDLSRRRPNLANSPLVQGVMVFVTRAPGP